MSDIDDALSWADACFSPEGFPQAPLPADLRPRATPSSLPSGPSGPSGASASLAFEIAHSDPRNPDHQVQLLARIRGLRSSLPPDVSADLAANLSMASTLSQYLVRMGGIGPEDVLQIMARLVSEVELASSEAARSRARVVLQTQGAADGGLRLVGRGSDSKGRLLGEILIQLGLASREQVQQALQVQRATGTRLGEALVGSGAVSWDQLGQAVAVQKQIKES